MDKEQALQSFWSSFGLTAYDDRTVPTGDNAPAFPYNTYELSTDELDHPLTLTASLWYRSSSWQDITAKCHEIERYIGEYGHRVIELSNGFLYITKEHPFAQRMGDDSDDMIRRIVLQIKAEFLTAY